MTRNTNSHRRMTIQARNRHNWSEAHLNHSLLQLRLPRRKSSLVPHMALSSLPTMFLPSDIGSPEGNSIYTVLEILPLRKAFLIGSQDLVAPDSRMWTTNTGLQPVVGSEQTSHHVVVHGRTRVPQACSSLPAPLSYPCSHLPSARPITSLLDRLQRLFAEHDDKLSVL